MNQIVIHCQPTLLETIKNLGYDWSFSQQFKEREIDVFVDNIEYKDGNHPDMNGYWEDPDIQLCNHYGIDYDQVNCLESLDYEDWVIR